MLLEISNNARSLTSCWRKYKFHYIDQIVPRKKKSHFILGGVVHKAFEMSATGATDSDILAYIKTTYEEELQQTELMDQEKVRTDMFTALGMWAHYPYKDLSEFSEYLPELEFKVSLGKKRGVKFVGRIDGLLKRNGYWWIREIKTTGLTPSQFKGRSATSAQASGYVYAMKKMGYPIAGMLYDVIKKPLLRKRVNENCDDFGYRIMADYEADSKVGENDRKAYLRHPEYRTDDQLRQWEEDMCMLVDDIRSRRKTGNWYRNTDTCWLYNTICEYSMICGQDVPDPTTLEVFFKQRGEE